MCGVASGMITTVIRFYKPADIRLEQTVVMAPSKPLQRIYRSSSTFPLPATMGTMMKLRYVPSIFYTPPPHRLLSSHM